MNPISASGPHESAGGVFRTTRFRSAAATAKRKKMSVTGEISRNTALVATNEIPQKTTATNAPRRGGIRIDAIVSALVVILHLICISRYGWFRDELYFIACSKHLAWGYVDQPPMIALLIWIARHLFGESLFALRIFAVLGHAALVLMTGSLVRRLSAAASLGTMLLACT